MRELIPPTTEAIAVIPYSQNVSPPDPGEEVQPVLSRLSCAAVDAAKLLYDPIDTERVVIAAEGPFRGYAPTAELMEERLTTGELAIPSDRIRVIPGYYDWTGSQALALARHFDKHPVARPGAIAVAALKYHLPRVRLHTDAHPSLRQATLYGAEAVLATSPRLAKHYQDLSILSELERQERIMRLVSRLDRQGNGLLQWLATRGSRGSRIVDIVPGPDGQPTIERWKSSQEKLAQIVAPRP